MGTIKQLKYWAYKILPLVYDNSLSYYEVLSKVTAKLNEVINTTNELPDAISTEIEKQLKGDGNVFQNLFSGIVNAIATDEGEATYTANDKEGGEIVWINGTLYEVVRTMAAGTNYIVGTNIVPISIDTLLGDIVKTISTHNEYWNERASEAHDTNTYLWWKGVLYRADADVKVNDVLAIMATENGETTGQLTAVNVMDEVTQHYLEMHEADNNLQTQIDGNDGDIENLQNTVSSNKQSADNEVKRLDTRIDNIVAQSSTDNTEVVDARLGAAVLNEPTGTTYASLGAAIRGQVTELYNDLQVKYSTKFIQIAQGDATATYPSFASLPMNKGCLVWKGNFSHWPDATNVYSALDGIDTSAFYFTSISGTASNSQLVSGNVQNFSGYAIHALLIGSSHIYVLSCTSRHTIEINGSYYPSWSVAYRISNSSDLTALIATCSKYHMTQVTAGFASYNALSLLPASRAVLTQKMYFNQWADATNIYNELGGSDTSTCFIIPLVGTVSTDVLALGSSTEGFNGYSTYALLIFGGRIYLITCTNARTVLIDSTYYPTWSISQELARQTDLTSLSNTIENIQEEISNLPTTSSNIVVDNTGTKYRIQAENGQLILVPVMATNVLYIGNSLLTGFGTQGMAAPTVDYDYYHMLNEKLGNPTARKLAGASFESQTTASGATSWIETNITNNNNINVDNDLVIIQLGSNVNNETKINVWETSCKELLLAIKAKCPKATICMVSSWFMSGTTVPTIAKQATEDVGGVFVSIENMINNSEYTSRLGSVYTRQDVTTVSYDVTSFDVNEDDKTITLHFTISGTEYSPVLTYESYTSTGGIQVSITGYQQCITNVDVARHPGTNGFTEITNRIVKALSI